MQKATKQAELIIALDGFTPEKARAFVDSISATGVKWFKVGLELFTLAGPAFVVELKRAGLHVFLDLKLHDIPNTIAKSVDAAINCGADMLTLHCLGGKKMLQTAAQTAKNSKINLVGVTLLTSHTAEDITDLANIFQSKKSNRSSSVAELAKLAFDSGLHGIVCSVPDLKETKKFDSIATANACFVTPGIRLKSDSAHDQASIATPREAVEFGSTHIVVGRSITQPSNNRAPKDVISEILSDLKV